MHIRGQGDCPGPLLPSFTPSLQKPFRKFPPPGLGEAWPSLTGHSAQPTLLETPGRPRPLLLGVRLMPTLLMSLPCPIVMDWTCGAVAAPLTLCALLELCKDGLVAHLFLCFPCGLARR